MKLSTRGRYGTRILLDLALHGDGKPVLLRDIAQRQKISLPYLEHLIAPLIAGGIVRSMRGAKGSVALAVPADKIKVSQIINLLEGSLAPVECVNNPDICSRSDTCVTRDLWNELKEAVEGVLESTTIKDLVERQQKRTAPQQKQAMYYV